MRSVKRYGKLLGLIGKEPDEDQARSLAVQKELLQTNTAILTEITSQHLDEKKERLERQKATQVMLEEDYYYRRRLLNQRSG